MATLGNVTYGLAGSNPAGNQFDLQKLDAAKYISLYEFVNKPDNRDALVKTRKSRYHWIPPVVGRNKSCCNK